MAAIDEIGVMREVRHPGDQPVVVEDRLEEDDVVEMRAAARIGVVADEDVAGPDRRKIVVLEDVIGDAEQRAEMDRDVLGLGDGASFSIEQGRRAVLPLLDVGRVGGADDGLAHLFDDGGERAADDLDGDRIELRLGLVQHGQPSMMRLRWASTVATCCGRTSVVESIWSMMAGPVTLWPGPSRSRS